MESQLHALEIKLAQLIAMSGKLRAENHQLRQDLAQAQSSNRQLGDKMDLAKERLERLLNNLPDEAHE
ncbi:MAG: hypothetical protein GJU76_00530 [Gallionella sp.]|jgi:regulator of replication initiation timing|nr:hypothetical protein [Gallionella sp.]